MKEIFLNYHMELMNPDRLPVVVMAWLLVTITGAITGPLHGNANPFLWLVFDKTLGKMGARLDNKDRKSRDLVFRGFIFFIICILIAYTFGKWAQSLSASYQFEGFTEIVLVSLTLAGGAVWFSLLRLFFAMRDNKPTKGAFYNIAQSGRRDLSGADDYTITRNAMAFGVRSFDKGLVAPVFWYMIIGLPGAFMYAVLGALCWRFGKDGYNKGFGAVALQIEKLLGLVPHMLAGVFVALAGLFTPTSGMTRALIGQIFHKGRSSYETGGLPLTAMAYALDVNLGGPATDLDGSAIKSGWVGPDKATAQLKEGYLKRAMYLLLMAHMLFITAVIGMMFWAGMLF